ncbi:hypothetical protein FACS189418_4720 [Clostridia bacterium]|nr:hypothetical protein FACS189418_4720 [Clostridia bacterium]
MNEQVLAQKQQLLSQFEKGTNIVLSTSLDDYVTSRTVTVISFQDNLYFASVKRPTALKFIQIEKNPNIALCTGSMKITGLAHIIGAVSAQENTELAALYKEKLPEAYAKYALPSDSVFIQIKLTTSKTSKMENGKLELTSTDYVQGSIEIHSI